jgi:TRAP-type mannitol/chloroaromatic compound transport system permease large subunit
MEIRQYVDVDDVAEWYNKKYECSGGDEVILDWMGMFDNGNITSFLYKSSVEQWVIDFFIDFPEIMDGVLIVYND